LKCHRLVLGFDTVVTRETRDRSRNTSDTLVRASREPKPLNRRAHESAPGPIEATVASEQPRCEFSVGADTVVHVTGVLSITRRDHSTSHAGRRLTSLAPFEHIG